MDLACTCLLNTARLHRLFLFVLIKGVSHPDRLVQITDISNDRSASAAERNVKYIVSVVYIDDLPACHRLLKYNQQKYGRFYKQRRLLEGQRINCSTYKEGVKGLEVASSD